MSYYPEHVYFQSQSTLTQTATSLRRCSVKGCGKDLPLDYALRMCDDCRGRHRKYATTKRAKRKQEKAAVGAQRIGNDDGRVVTWMPPDHHVSVGPIPEDSDPVPVRPAAISRILLTNYVNRRICTPARSIHSSLTQPHPSLQARLPYLPSIHPATRTTHISRHQPRQMGLQRHHLRADLQDSHAIALSKAVAPLSAETISSKCVSPAVTATAVMG